MGQTCGIGKKTQRATTRPKITYWGSEITEIHQIQYRYPIRQEKARSCAVKGCKGPDFLGQKSKEGATEGSMTRAATKVQNNSKNFITLSLQVGITAYIQCKGIILLIHHKYIIVKIVLVSIYQELKR